MAHGQSASTKTQSRAAGDASRRARHARTGRRATPCPPGPHSAAIHLLTSSQTRWPAQRGRQEEPVEPSPCHSASGLPRPCQRAPRTLMHGHQASVTGGGLALVSGHRRACLCAPPLQLTAAGGRGGPAGGAPACLGGPAPAVARSLRKLVETGPPELLKASRTALAGLRPARVWPAARHGRGSYRPHGLRDPQFAGGGGDNPPLPGRRRRHISAAPPPLSAASSPTMRPGPPPPPEALRRRWWASTR